LRLGCEGNYTVPVERIIKEGRKRERGEEGTEKEKGQKKKGRKKRRKQIIYIMHQRFNGSTYSLTKFASRPGELSQAQPIHSIVAGSRKHSQDLITLSVTFSTPSVSSCCILTIHQNMKKVENSITSSRKRGRRWVLESALVHGLLLFGATQSMAQDANSTMFPTVIVNATLSPTDSSNPSASPSLLASGSPSPFPAPPPSDAPTDAPVDVVTPPPTAAPTDAPADIVTPTLTPAEVPG
jgi:hypothetical protein